MRLVVLAIETNMFFRAFEISIEGTDEVGPALHKVFETVYRFAPFRDVRRVREVRDVNALFPCRTTSQSDISGCPANN